MSLRACNRSLQQSLYPISEECEQETLPQLLHFPHLKITFRAGSWGRVRDIHAMPHKDSLLSWEAWWEDEEHTVLGCAHLQGNFYLSEPGERRGKEQAWFKHNRPLLVLLHLVNCLHLLSVLELLTLWLVFKNIIFTGG